MCSVDGGIVITVRIGDSEREFHNASESWIMEQINKRRKNGQSVCVRVIVDQRPDLNLILSTPNCPATGGSSRPPNSKESMIFDLWDKNGLNKPEYSGGRLIAFLKQLRHNI